MRMIKLDMSQRLHIN